jgi:hypothetical protein
MQHISFILDARGFELHKRVISLSLINVLFFYYFTFFDIKATSLKLTFHILTSKGPW